MQEVYNNETISCVGTVTEYVSLLNVYEKQKSSLVYYGEQFSNARPFCKKVLLLNVDIFNISFCIKNTVENVMFFHNRQILAQTDEILLNRLEQEYVRKHTYDSLKELNLIKLVFNIQKNSVALTSLPVHIQMEHTTFCNAKCIMCDHYIAHNRGSKHLKLSTVQTIEPLLAYASMVIMHGNGEPLLNPDLPEIFELYKKYQVSVSLNTNLSYLTDDILWALKNRCTSVHVSCDGSYEQQYESIRLGLSYSNFVRNVKRLQSICSDTEKVLEVVLMRQNIKDTVRFVRFAYDNGFSKVIFNPLGCNKWIENFNDGLHNFLSAASYFCSIAKNEGVRLGVTVVTPFESACDFNTDNIILPKVCYMTKEQGLANSETLHKKYPWYTNTIAVENLDLHCVFECDSSHGIQGVCEYPFAKTYIDLLGNVSFCCPASRKIVDTISSSHSFQDIWNSEAYQKIRGSFYQKRLPLLCRECYFIQRGNLQFMDIQEQENGENA